MIREFLQNHVTPTWQTMALVLFMLFFVGVVLWVWLRGRDLERLRQLPLEEEGSVHPEQGGGR